MSKDDLQKALLEKLAELEHEQWKELIQHLLSERLLHLDKWQFQRIRDLMKKSYCQLSEYQKESDRKFAGKVLVVFDETLTDKVSVDRKQLSDIIIGHCSGYYHCHRSSYDELKELLEGSGEHLNLAFAFADVKKKKGSESGKK